MPSYLDRQRLIRDEDSAAPDTPLGLEIPDDRNPAAFSYRYKKDGPAAPAPRKPSTPDVQYSRSGKPMIWRKGQEADPAVTRTRARLLNNSDFEGRFRDRSPTAPQSTAPDKPQSIPWMKAPEAEVAQPEASHSESTDTLWDKGREFWWDDMSEVEQGERVELLAQRPRNMHRDITEFESLQNLMSETPGETRGTEEAMDSMVGPRGTRTHMRNQTPNYWPGSTDPREFDADWDPREAVVHPDRADNRRNRLVTSRGAPPRLISAMDNMFQEHTGENNPFAGPEASKRIRK